MSEKQKKQNPLTFKDKSRSIWSGVKKFFRVKRNNFKKFISSESYKIPQTQILTILMNGFMFTIALTYFVGFKYWLIPITGCAWYILKKEVFPELKQLIASLNIIKVGK